jgi:hypothetical protein
MEVQRVPRAELLHGNLRVSLYGPRSTEYQTDGTDGGCRPNHVETLVGATMRTDSGQVS